MRTLFVFFICLCVLLSGCGTISEKSCIEADWKVIGYNDGASGAEKLTVSDYKDACAEYSIKPDPEQYLAGFADGLEMFCTFDKGLELGKNGDDFNGMCPPETFPDFAEAYNAGAKWHAVYIKLNKVERDVSSIERKINDTERRIEQAGSSSVSGSSDESSSMSKTAMSRLGQELGAYERDLDKLQTKRLLLEEKFDIRQDELDAFLEKQKAK